MQAEDQTSRTSPSHAACCCLKSASQAAVKRGPSCPSSMPVKNARQAELEAGSLETIEPRRKRMQVMPALDARAARSLIRVPGPVKNHKPSNFLLGDILGEGRNQSV